MSLPVSTRRSWVKSNSSYSIRRQCRLAGLSRSHIYYQAACESEENLMLMRLIDEQYMKHPEYGYRRMTDWLHDPRLCVQSETRFAADAAHGSSGDYARPSHQPPCSQSQNIPVFIA